MERKFIIKNIDQEASTIEIDYIYNKISQSVILPFPTFDEDKILTAKDVKYFVMQNFPWFDPNLINQEENKKNTLTFDDEALTLVGKEISQEDVDIEDSLQSEREGHVTTMYGYNYNIMSTRHIIIDTLKQLGVIK